MKLFGIEFKFNGYDIWHRGNFDPASKVDKAEFDNLEIGGRNLFKETNILNINAYVGGSSQGTYSGRLNFVSNRTCIVIEVEEGETYSVSYKEHKIGNRFSFGFYTNYEGDVPDATVGKFDWWEYPDTNGIFEGYIAPQGCKYLILYFSNTSFDINKIPKGFKIEKGNKATDWTPAPEDIQAEIDKKADKTELPTKLSQLTKDINFDERYYTETEVNTKLDGKVDNSRVLTDVPANAKFTDTIYTHPTTSGNKHIPSGGSSGQFLKWQSDGTAIWDNVPGGLTLGETSGTAYRGDRGKIAYDHSQTAHAPSNAQKNSDITNVEIENALGYTPVNKAGDNITGQLGVESTTFPVIDIVRNTSSSGGGLYGGARLRRKTTNPTNGVGIGFYFQATNSNKAMTHAGMFGGALGTIQAGSEKGEIVISPSYAGQDPYLRRDLIVRAISTSKAEAELNGKLKTDQTLASDSNDTVATKGYVDDKASSDIYHVGTSPPSDTNLFWIDTSE